ncbi:glycosyltransferase family 2 protein [Haloarcula amylovorans]|uniref:glycosyltransferase family 2 protein n=1 Tax=Haloarcula amylovorans TaxID=2562280 RepID=UPI001076754D|nr:glycosyltransferase family 2 protein [Halomicroarcula amylolytica]
MSQLETAKQTTETPSEIGGEISEPGIAPLSETMVAIPAYNEAVGIGSVVLTANRIVDRVVVVDDGSSDATVEIARDAGAMVIEHDENRGKGAAIQTIFDHAVETGYECVVLIDGDGQHLPEEIPDVAAPVLQGNCEMTIGSRYLEGGNTETPFYRRVGQRVLDVLATGSTDSSISDSQSGFRAFSVDALDELRITTDGMGVESEMISRANENDVSIEEVPIDIRYEGIDGQTYNPLRHGLTVVAFILQLVRDRHPMVFFGLPGLVLLTLGALYGLNGILVYQNTGVFYPAKTLVSGFSTVLGALGLFTGLMLNQISNMIKEIE